MLNRDEMLDALSYGVCRVKFTKVNGEFRDMTCTRNFDSIPVEQRPSSVTDHADNGKRGETSIPVYDLKAQGWRSFKVASVEYFEVTN
jgi:hypothetical protein